MKIISTGKYDTPIIRTKIMRYYTATIPYKYYVQILWAKIPITGKEYTTINNIINRVKGKSE